ncbi:MAG: hypothetical protein L6R39_001508 [Caloplaca ligustica]|nr:MAG: hypothetical protein L6R39_001508 [Caloplaca ligustica]
MYYSGAPATPQSDQVVVDATRLNEPSGVRSTKRPHDPTSSKARPKPARPGLTLSIPSTKSKRPVEKSHLSPDSALDDRHALDMACQDSKMGRAIGSPRRIFFPAVDPRTPIEKSAYSGPSAAMNVSARTNPSGTHASSDKPSDLASMKVAKAPKRANLCDELALFSITSQDEDLSAWCEEPLARSVKVVSAVQSDEIKSSIHDWAHEKHRELATQLTSGCLDVVRRHARKGEVDHESTSKTESK